MRKCEERVETAYRYGLHLSGLVSLLQMCFEVLTAVIFQIGVFWVATPCDLEGGYLRFEGACCLLQSEP